MGRLIDLTGMRFGRLIVLKRDPNTSIGLPVKWICKCNCGNISKVQGGNLKSKSIVSCGCYIQEVRTTHGKSNILEYKIWQGILDRCNNSNCKNYFHYGGRGITVCERWKNSFENFYKDMGPRPSDKYSIDRIDNNGNYQPSNCKWSSRKDQARNTRKNVIESLEQAEEIRTKYKTGKYTQQELSKMYSCSYVNMNNIINNKRWI